MNKAKLLKSDRLILRPIELSHATDTYLSWLNDEEVNKFLDSIGNYTIDDLKDYIQDICLNNIYFWGIHIKDSNKHIGNIKIDSISERNNTGTYGILLGEKNEWGKGYAKEASNLIIDFCFQELNIRKIRLGVIENNIDAVNLYYKLGFILEGKLLNHGKYDGEYCNSLEMALFNEHYEYKK
jgi:RimJ/RimL family protein N-acetyltransferase